jgi:hypothetical protein
VGDQLKITTDYRIGNHFIPEIMIGGIKVGLETTERLSSYLNDKGFSPGKDAL